MLCYITWYCRKKRWFKGRPSVATFTPWRVLVMWRFAAKHVSTNCLERRPLPPSERAPLAVWNTELLLDVVMAANALGKLWLWASQSWQVEWIRPNHWNRELRAGSMPMNYTYTFNHIHIRRIHQNTLCGTPIWRSFELERSWERERGHANHSTHTKSCSCCCSAAAVQLQCRIISLTWWIACWALQVDLSWA